VARKYVLMKDTSEAGKRIIIFFYEVAAMAGFVCE
jgi:hypothetical protein